MDAAMASQLPPLREDTNIAVLIYVIYILGFIGVVCW